MLIPGPSTPVESQVMGGFVYSNGETELNFAWLNVQTPLPSWVWINELGLLKVSVINGYFDAYDNSISSPDLNWGTIFNVQPPYTKLYNGFYTADLGFTFYIYNQNKWLQIYTTTFFNATTTDIIYLPNSGEIEGPLYYYSFVNGILIPIYWYKKNTSADPTYIYDTLTNVYKSTSPLQSSFRYVFNNLDGWIFLGIPPSSKEIRYSNLEFLFISLLKNGYFNVQLPFF